MTLEDVAAIARQWLNHHRVEATDQIQINRRIGSIESAVRSLLPDDAQWAIPDPTLGNPPTLIAHDQAALFVIENRDAEDAVRLSCRRIPLTRVTGLEVEEELGYDHGALYQMRTWTARAEPDEQIVFAGRSYAEGDEASKADMFAISLARALGWEIADLRIIANMMGSLSFEPR